MEGKTYVAETFIAKKLYIRKYASK